MAEKVCPAWLGYFLASPLRRIIHPPQTILAPYVKEGMTVLDIGCGMGFFSIPLARMVGARGKVICVDMQEKMLKGLEKRAQRASVSTRIEARLCYQHTIGLQELAEKIYDVEMPMFPTDGHYDSKAVGVVVQSLVDTGQMDAATDVKALITEQFLN